MSRGSCRKSSPPGVTDFRSISISKRNVNKEEIKTDTSCNSAEEDPEEYPFPLTLHTKQPGGESPLPPAALNGN